MRRFGFELEFINRISADGKELLPVETMGEGLLNTEFELKRLSITEDTYIASNFHTYVVKLAGKRK